VAKSERASGRRFDRDHGVTTHAVLFLSDLDPEATSDARSHATHYEAVPVSAFRALMHCIPDGVLPDSTFVDVGAGMGRAMLLATEYPFKQIVGIELSPGLHEIARENIAKGYDFATRCSDVRLVRGDARKRQYPRGSLVVFLYNPFDGEALDAVLERLAERRDGGNEWVLYHVPVHADRLRERGYELVAEIADGHVYRRQRV
jgi:trans-aconitate methyltransferase